MGCFDIIALLDSTDKVVIYYEYDAWGNHAVLDSEGYDIEDTNHIGNVNPFRYRSYYYDPETGLYYPQTRYYDPETINGLNLYSYCLNNLAMHADLT